MAQPIQNENFLVNQIIEFTNAGYTFIGRRTQISQNIEPTQIIEPILSQTFPKTPASDTTTFYSILETPWFEKKKRVYRKPAKGSTVAMTAWLCDHPMNPYPTNAVRREFGTKFDMTLTQVSNWFANARRRNKQKKALRKKTLISEAPVFKNDPTV